MIKYEEPISSAAYIHSAHELETVEENIFACKELTILVTVTFAKIL